MKRGLLALMIALLMLMGIAMPASADTADPDSTPTIESFNVYRNILETGDWLLIIYANIPYAVAPSTPVSDTFIWRLLDTDDTTVFGSTVGTNYNESGYGYNVYSLYFTAAEVTALGIVWDTVYPVRLSGNPAVFDTPPIYNYALNVANYSTETDSDTVQTEIADRVLVIANSLNSRWGLDTTTSLIAETESGTALSTNGETFFRAAIFGLQALAPEAFSVIIRNIDVDDRDWDSDYTDNLTGQWSGSWVDTARAAGQALFGTDYDLFSIIIVLVLSTGLLIGNIMLTGDHWNGLVDVTVWAVIGARLAMYDLAFLLMVAALCWLYISMKVWFGMIK